MLLLRKPVSHDLRNAARQSTATRLDAPSKDPAHLLRARSAELGAAKRYAQPAYVSSIDHSRSGFRLKARFTETRF